MNELDNNEKRFTKSSIKMITNLVLVLVVITALVLFNFFALDGFGGSTRDTVWWISKAMSGLGTFVVMLGISNSVEERLKIKNGNFLDKVNKLDKYYTQVLENGEGDWIDLYLTNINKRSKYNSYIKKQKQKLHIAKKFVPYKKRKTSDKIIHLEKTLIVNSEDVWAMEKRIKYPQLTFGKLVSGAYSITERELDDNDVSIHRGDAVAKKLIWKIVLICGFGMFVPDFVYHFTEWDNSMILPLISRIATILWAIYCGVAFAYYMHDRVMVSLRKKLKKFSEFRTRTDNEQFKTLPVEQRYSVKITEDAIINKLKKKYNVTELEPNLNGLKVDVEEVVIEDKGKTEEVPHNALAKTIQEIDKPMSVGAMGNILLENIIKEGAKNDT